MYNSIDINNELKEKNQEMFLNKKKVDLDKSMESLLVFYSNYLSTQAIEINNKVCSFANIDSESDQGKIMYNTISTCFQLISDKLKELINQQTELIKNKIDNISDEEYNNELTNMSSNINNQMKVFYNEQFDMLLEALTSDITDDVTKDRINNYLVEIVFVKMIDMLKDKFMYSIKVIDNNYEENNQIIQRINEKTLNKA